MENYLKMRIAELTLEAERCSMAYEKLMKQSIIKELEKCLIELKK